MAPSKNIDPLSQKARRRRLIASCTECHRRKLKCDRLRPCNNCGKASRDCLYLVPSETAPRNSRPVKTVPSSDASALPATEASNSESEGPIPEDEIALKPMPLAVADTSYEDDVDDELLDLGIRIGKMCMNERLGGFFRPKISEELGNSLQNPEFEQRTIEEKTVEAPELLDNAEDFLEPGPTYIGPGAEFVFGYTNVEMSLINFLPSRDDCDKLVNIYYENVHFIARVVHWPSFQSSYENFWTIISYEIEPTPSQYALVLSTIFSGVVSMPDLSVTAIFNQPKHIVQSNLQRGVEAALTKAHFLRTTKIETMQAWVMYLIPMCRDQMSRAHSAIVGSLVRVAECMGLHRDPAEVHGLPPIECHVRRILWFQVCFLDWRTGEIQGPRPCIRRDDYDTKFPLHVDDVNLSNHSTKETNTRFTDMTLCRIRFECMEMHRIIWYDRIRLEKKKTSLTHVLGKIETFRKAMQARYSHVLDTSIPIQHYAECCLRLFLSRMHIMVLHRYLHNAQNQVPARLRQLVWTSGTLNLEALYDLETTSAFEKWHWYTGAHQQWHTALLLVHQVYSKPDIPEADRIWKVVDYVFQPDLSLSRVQKARSILGTVKNRTATYRHLRRMRTPQVMRSESVWRAVKTNPMSPVEPQLQRVILRQNSTSITSPGNSTSDKASPYSRITTSDEMSQTTNGTAVSGTHSHSPFASTDPTSIEKPFDHGIQVFETSQLLSKESSASQDHAITSYFDLNSPNDDDNMQDFWPTVIDSKSQQLETMAHPTGQVDTAEHRSMNSSGNVANPYMQTNSLSNTLQGIQNAVTNDVTMTLDVDWTEWDKLFPVDQNTGNLNIWST